MAREMIFVYRDQEIRVADRMGQLGSTLKHIREQYEAMQQHAAALAGGEEDRCNSVPN